MASEDVIELGSSDEDAEPPPKKKKPMPNAMVHIPTNLPGITIQPAKSNPSVQKGLLIKPIKISNSTSKVINKNKPNVAQIRMPENRIQRGTRMLIPIHNKFPKDIPKLPVQVPHRFSINPAHLIKNLNKTQVVVNRVPINNKKVRNPMHVQGPRLLKNLPSSITIKQVPGGAGVSGSKKQRTQIAPKSSIGDVLTVEIDDEDVPEVSTASPQWYLTPEKQAESMKEVETDKSKDLDISQSDSLESMEESNNKEPDTTNYVEITIEDSPVKPVYSKNTNEVGMEYSITIEDSPVKVIQRNDKNSKKKLQSEDEDDQGSSSAPNSKKRLDYPKSDDLQKQKHTVEIEIDLIEIDPNVDNKNKKTDNKSGKKYNSMNQQTSKQDIEKEMNNEDNKDNNKDNETEEDKDMSTCAITCEQLDISNNEESSKQESKKDREKDRNSKIEKLNMKEINMESEKLKEISKNKKSEQNSSSNEDHSIQEVEQEKYKETWKEVNQNRNPTEYKNSSSFAEKNTDREKKRKENERRERKEKQVTESCEFHPVYKNFIDMCFKLENSDDMKKIVEKKIKAYYNQCPKEYVESEEFIDMVSSKIISMKAAPQKMYLYIKDVVDELNLQRKMAKTVSTKKVGDVKETSSFMYQDQGEYDHKRKRQIRKLEKTIKKLHRAIQKLEEQEVDFEDEEDSVYLLTERYKERMIRVHAKFCQLTNTKMPSEPRIHIEARPGRPTGPARKIEKWINRKVPIGAPLPFPDFHDVLRCVREANEEDRLGWNDFEIMEEARDLFTRCGKKLQRRRQENEWRLAASRITQDTDPAEDSGDLKKKLDENRIEAAKKETELLNKYVDRQNQLKLEAEEINDKEADESPIESEEEVVEDENLLEDKQKRKDRLKRLLQEKSKRNEDKESPQTKPEAENKNEGAMDVDEIKVTEQDNKNKLPEDEQNKMEIDVVHDKKEENDQKEKKDDSEDKNEESAKSVIEDKEDEVYDVESDIDELHLLQKLHSENEANTSNLESSDSDTPIAISDTLESDSESGSNKKISCEIISIENSSYSESESNIEIPEKSIDPQNIEQLINDKLVVEFSKIAKGKTVDTTEAVLLASSDDEEGKSNSVTLKDDGENLKDDNTSITEIVVERENIEESDDTCKKIKDYKISINKTSVDGKSFAEKSVKNMCLDTSSVETIDEEDETSMNLKNDSIANNETIMDIESLNGQSPMEQTVEERNDNCINLNDDSISITETIMDIESPAQKSIEESVDNCINLNEDNISINETIIDGEALAEKTFEENSGTCINLNDDNISITETIVNIQSFTNETIKGSTCINLNDDNISINETIMDGESPSGRCTDESNNTCEDGEHSTEKKNEEDHNRCEDRERNKIDGESRSEKNMGGDNNASVDTDSPVERNIDNPEMLIKRDRNCVKDNQECAYDENAKDQVSPDNESSVTLHTVVECPRYDSDATLNDSQKSVDIKSVSNCNFTESENLTNSKHDENNKHQTGNISDNADLTVDKSEIVFSNNNVEIGNISNIENDATCRETNN